MSAAMSPQIKEIVSGSGHNKLFTMAVLITMSIRNIHPRASAAWRGRNIHEANATGIAKIGVRPRLLVTIRPKTIKKPQTKKLSKKMAKRRWSGREGKGRRKRKNLDRWDISLAPFYKEQRKERTKSPPMNVDEAASHKGHKDFI
jgi:hypothetical protein